MTPFRHVAGALLAAAVLASPLAAQAHRMWMVPSATVLSGDEAWVTVDAAVSNTLFHPDHVPMRLDGVVVVGPDGEQAAPLNPATGKYRSTFDVRLSKPGTYRIASASDMLTASYQHGGETKRWRGSAAQLPQAIPGDATDVRLTHHQRRLETFVTLGAPTTDTLRPSGRGLELEPISHPNDLVASEPARFRLLLDGRPAADVEVEVVAGGGRYRSDPREQRLRSGADGILEIAWPAAGMYWLEASAPGGASEVEGAARNAVYVATFEVLPD